MQEVETGAKPGRGRKKKVVVPPDVKLEAEEEPDKQTTESQVSCKNKKLIKNVILIIKIFRVYPSTTGITLELR